MKSRSFISRWFKTSPLTIAAATTTRNEPLTIKASTFCFYIMALYALLHSPKKSRWRLLIVRGGSESSFQGFFVSPREWKVVESSWRIFLSFVYSAHWSRRHVQINFGGWGEAGHLRTNKQNPNSWPSWFDFRRRLITISDWCLRQNHEKAISINHWRVSFIEWKRIQYHFRDDTRVRSDNFNMHI